jgi:hypothetical protein
MLHTPPQFTRAGATQLSGWFFERDDKEVNASGRAGYIARAPVDAACSLGAKTQKGFLNFKSRKPVRKQI